jgi:predicted hydrocarbon binding protein
MSRSSVSPGSGGTVKGVGLANTRRFTVEKHGEVGWTRLLERLSVEDREVLSSAITAGWYDIALIDRVNHAFAECCGGLGAARELGRYAAEQDLKTIHRMFLRLANPAYALEKCVELWRRYNTTGQWSVERPAPNHVRATLRGWGERDTATCARLTGHLERLLELVGARNATVEHSRCVARGDEACVFEGKWGQMLGGG